MINTLFRDIPVSTIRKIFNLILGVLGFIAQVTCNSFSCVFLVISKLKKWREKYLQRHLTKQRMRNSKNYDEWLRYAVIYDRSKGWNRWRSIRKSTHYDYKYIGKLEMLLKIYMDQENYPALMNLLQANTSRNIGGILNSPLYERSLSGTKELITLYQQRVIEAFKEILATPNITKEKKIEFFGELKHAYGRSALLLSGGGLLGMIHFGVIKTLAKYKMLPKIISGSSAGALMAAFVGTTKMEDMYDTIDQMKIKFDAFKKKNSSAKAAIMRRIVRFISKGNLLEKNNVAEWMKENVGEITFREAFDKTGIIINIVVAGDKHEQYKVLNYLTAPNVMVYSAAVTSCSIPLVFGSSKILCKDELGNIKEWLPVDKQFLDGTLGADLPKKKMAELFNVNYFIVSQTNPLISTFMNSKRSNLTSRAYHWYNFLAVIIQLITSEIKYRIGQLASLGLIHHTLIKWMNLLTQDYSGNLTLNPKPSFKEYMSLLKFPSKEQCKKFTRKGELITFPEMCRINQVLKIEKVLERCYKISKRSYNKKKKKKLSMVQERREERLGSRDRIDSNESPKVESLLKSITIGCGILKKTEEEEDEDNLSNNLNNQIKDKENRLKQTKSVYRIGRRGSNESFKSFTTTDHMTSVDPKEPVTPNHIKRVDSFNIPRVPSDESLSSNISEYLAKNKLILG